MAFKGLLQLKLFSDFHDSTAGIGSLLGFLLLSLSAGKSQLFLVCSAFLLSAEQILEKKLCPIVLLYAYIAASTGN